ncbi:XRE family transcriptional regulator [Micromonospora sp. Llam0]|uniref:helix-turn-helix domain-containing protein n=1 Tax=Micromonospora sp. Llam0 TaxID=2485143 RepID=UPI000FAAC77B|nr:cupin domain-containing protein [Micromonospora sp. Llam0]ROO59203.1 XRE family transcriptional regulator [Micromonospora sp. Llam0]
MSEAEDLGGRIRAARQARGMSLRALAKKVGVSASMLSLVETGRSRSSVSTLYAIVEALDMSMVDLFDTPPSPNGSAPVPAAATIEARLDSEVAIVRRDQGRRIEMDSGVVWEQLGPATGSGTEFLRVTYPPGAKSSVSGRFQRHTGHEHAYIMDGELTCQVGFQEVVLGTGDSMVFDSSRPHLLENRSDQDVHAIWFIVRPRPDSGP